FRDVEFAYPTRDTPVLRGVSLDVAAGECVAVVGGSGSGKSTLAALLARLYDPQLGHVAVDGRDVRSVDPGELRRAIGFVSQDPVLFHGTVYDNVAYGALGDTSLDAVRAAARLANA